MSLRVAETILEQLGSRRFLAMTGAKSLVAGGRTLTFALPRGVARSGINKVRVTLDTSDTYTVEFCRMRPRTRTLLLKILKNGVDTNVVTVDSVSDVYNDQLQ